MLEQLIEQARDLYHCLALLLGGVWRESRQGISRQRPIIGGRFPSFQTPATCFGQEWFPVDKHNNVNSWADPGEPFQNCQHMAH
jgi:hypothetical protein